jgi:hypothetical protein
MSMKMKAFGSMQEREMQLKTNTVHAMYFPARASPQPSSCSAIGNDMV